MIYYNCEHCNAALETDDSVTGKEDPCPICGKTNRAPILEKQVICSKSNPIRKLRKNLIKLICSSYLIYYECMNCGAELETPKELAGKTEECPTCGKFNFVPASKKNWGGGKYDLVLVSKKQLGQGSTINGKVFVEIFFACMMLLYVVVTISSKIQHNKEEYRLSEQRRERREYELMSPGQQQLYDDVKFSERQQLLDDVKFLKQCDKIDEQLDRAREFIELDIELEKKSEK